MRRRFKRRSRPLWFPPLGSDQLSGEAFVVNLGFSTFSFAVTPGATTFEFPLTYDFGQEAALAGPLTTRASKTLADIMGSTWRLRRIVGNVFATFIPEGVGNDDPTLTAYQAAYFGAGFMVRKVSNTGAAFTDVGVFDADDYDDPWIWRRTWILGQGAGTLRDQGFNGAGVANLLVNRPVSNAGPFGDDSIAAFCQFPRSTAHYSGLHSASYFDQKTNRLIGPEDRLFIHLTTKGLPIQPVDNASENSRVVGIYDLRMLGFLGRSSNRRNASR